MKPYLQIIARGEALTEAQAEAAMHLIMKGEAVPERVAAFLMGLRARGETLPELVGFTRVMREYAVSVAVEDEHAIDLCGTGGDDAGTFNISTTATLVCAGAGVTVAKHGNRSVSSKCGSADVLEALGVKIELRKAGVEYCLREAGTAFIFAPYFHPAMRHVMPVRKKLGARTFFNILGPLCNPAGVQRQLVGAFSTAMARQIMAILAHTGSERVMAVHARDGLDELSLAAPTALFAFDAATDEPGQIDQQLQGEIVEPEQHGLAAAPLSALQGGGVEKNAQMLTAVLDGKAGPPRDVVLLNAAYALHASGRFGDLAGCFEAARESIDSGAAKRALQRLADASQEAPTD